MSSPLSENLRVFVASVSWTFAKTYARSWPHEYIVRDRVDRALFVKLVEHIRSNGYEGRFYQNVITYFDEDGLVYWTMGAPIEETTVVNRCRKEQTYEYRLKHATLPDMPVSRLEQALAYSAEVHSTQRRKGTTVPYVSHPRRARLPRALDVGVRQPLVRLEQSRWQSTTPDAEP